MQLFDRDPEKLASMYNGSIENTAINEEWLRSYQTPLQLPQRQAKTKLHNSYLPEKFQWHVIARPSTQLCPLLSFLLSSPMFWYRQHVSLQLQDVFRLTYPALFGILPLSNTCFLSPYSFSTSLFQIFLLLLLWVIHLSSLYRTHDIAPSFVIFEWLHMWFFFFPTTLMH